jgi:hypothetical protein
MIPAAPPALWGVGRDSENWQMKGKGGGIGRKCQSWIRVVSYSKFKTKKGEQE